MEEKTILIIEDEKELAEILADYLGIEGFQVLLSFDGEEGLKLFKFRKPELVLLDIMLPKVNGMEVCKQIRLMSNIPIIMVSAKSGEMDKVISLGIGADDYVTKPFSPLELVARVKAHLRRYQELGQKETSSKLLTVGKLRISKESYEASIDGIIIDLTTKEFEVLYFFANHVNLVFSKEQIYGEVWGMNEFGDISSVAVYIKRIREKLNLFGLDYIKTIWGVGYKLSV